MHFKMVLISIGAYALTGCVSSFQARPSPVIPMSDVMAMLTAYKQDVAINAFHSSNAADRKSLDPKNYRNMVISLYLSAIDSKYENFVTAVSTQNKGSDLTLGTAALGLSSAATVTKKSAANILSAGAAFATGTQSSVNQKLFFDRTFPALLASMDASRKEVKATILQKMASSASDYPIEVAFADLYDYQSSASLDEAVQRITVNAGNDVRHAISEVANARVNLDKATDGGNKKGISVQPLRARQVPAVVPAISIPAAPAVP